MIRFDERHDLVGEQRDRVRALFDRQHEINDMPDTLQKVEAYEQQVQDCLAAEFPHLAASSRFYQYGIYVNAGLSSEALDVYARLMQLIRVHGEYIDAGNVRGFLSTVSGLANTMLDVPSTPLSQVAQVIDLVEAATRDWGGSLGGVYYARAELAMRAGDRAALDSWRQRWLTAGDDYWTPDNPDTAIHNVVFLNALDRRAAAEYARTFLEAQGFGITGPIATDPDTVRTVANLRAVLAATLVRLGEQDRAREIADDLADQVGLDFLARAVELPNLLVIFEHRPVDALLLVDEYGLTDLTFQHTDWTLLAAVARSRLLAAPTGEEGRLLRICAEQEAGAHDARNGNGLAVAELDGFWFAGLPALAPPPAATDADWDDPDERAERILRVGWLARRRDQLTLDAVPYALRDRFLEYAQEAPTRVYQAADDAEADAALAWLVRRSEELRSDLGLLTGMVLHGGRAATAGETEMLLADCTASRDLLAARTGSGDDAIVDAVLGVFGICVEAALLDPRIDLTTAHDLIDREVEVRTQLAAPMSPVLAARVQVAAHLGESDELKALLPAYLDVVAEEADRADRYHAVLSVLPYVSPYDPAFVHHQARQVLAESANPQQQRMAQAWLAWLELRSGSDGDGAEQQQARDLLRQVDGDVNEYDAVCLPVLVSIARRDDGLLGRLVEAMLGEEDDYLPTDDQLLGALAVALALRDPEDPRAAGYRQRVKTLAAERDARNGNTTQSQLITWHFGF